MADYRPVILFNLLGLLKADFRHQITPPVSTSVCKSKNTLLKTHSGTIITPDTTNKNSFGSRESICIRSPRLLQRSILTAGYVWINLWSKPLNQDPDGVHRGHPALVAQSLLLGVTCRETRRLPCRTTRALALMGVSLPPHSPGGPELLIPSISCPQGRKMAL